MTDNEMPGERLNQTSDNESWQDRSLGNLLHKTRTSQQKSLEEAAAETRINVSFLYAIEENDFEKLPDEIFTRGFIKIYAKYLGLDPDDTLSHYLSQVGTSPGNPAESPFHKETINTELLDRTSIFIIKKSRKIMPVIILLFILIVFYLLGVFFNSVEKPLDILPENVAVYSPVGEAPSTKSPETITSEDGSGEPNGEEKSPTLPETVPEPLVKAPAQVKQQVADKTTPTEEAVGSPPAGSKEKPAPAPAEIQPEEQPTEQAAAEILARTRPVEPAKAKSLPITVAVATEPIQAAMPPVATETDFKYVLEASFAEESILSIKIDDRPILSYNPQAGTTRTWRAHKSITLNLENSRGASLILNGRPLDVAGAKGAPATIKIPVETAEDILP